MVNKYCPSRGDIVYINFNPQSGKEQAGKRPALVISHQDYNNIVGLAILCPITSSVKGYPFEVKIPSSCKTKGVILSDHVKNLDYTARKIKFIEKLPKSSLEAVLEKLSLLIE